MKAKFSSVRAYTSQKTPESSSALQIWLVFDLTISQIHAMLSVDLSMLSPMNFVSCKMVKYLARNLEMKVDVHMEFCLILSQ